MCKVGILREELLPQGVLVYIVLGARPIDERKQLPKEKVATIEHFLNQQSKLSKKKIKLVSHDLVRNIESCYAEVIKEVGLLQHQPKIVDIDVKQSSDNFSNQRSQRK
jgi:hypothetical protein